MEDVTMHIDMPKADGDLQVASRSARSMLQTAVPTARGMRCHGNYSDQLRVCWDTIVRGSSCKFSDGYWSWVREYYPNWYDKGFLYEGIGLVDLEGWYFVDYVAQAIQAISRGFTDRLAPKWNKTVCEFTWNRGDWYGVHWTYDGATYVTTDRCSYFLARWGPDGECY